jgi:hypothetical protein
MYAEAAADRSLAGSPPFGIPDDQRRIDRDDNLPAGVRLDPIEDLAIRGDPSGIDYEALLYGAKPRPSSFAPREIDSYETHARFLTRWRPAGYTTGFRLESVARPENGITRLAGRTAVPPARIELAHAV